jgi:hypothetical protein
MIKQPEKPAELHGHIQAAQPHGQAVYRRLGIQIFEAALWMDAKTWSMNLVFALSIRYERSFAAYDLIEKTLADMHRLEKLGPKERTAYPTELDRLFRDVRRGDVITALYIPDQGATFFYNSAPTGIADISLSQRFFDIWFSPRTSEPALRNALLSGNT